MSATRETTIPGAKLTVRLQTGGADLIQELAADWRSLYDEAGDEIFYRPEWTQAYLSAFAPQMKITLISVWAGQRLRALLPLVREQIWITGLPAVRLTLPANVHCLRVGLAICTGEEGDEALRALWQAVKELPGWNI